MKKTNKNNVEPITAEDLKDFQENMTKYVYSMSPEDQKEFRQNLAEYVSQCTEKINTLRNKLDNEIILSNQDRSNDLNGMGVSGAISFVTTLATNLGIAFNVNPDLFYDENVAKPALFMLLTVIEGFVVSLLNETAYANRPLSNKIHQFKAQRLGKQIAKLKRDISTGIVVMTAMDIADHEDSEDNIDTQEM